MNHLQALHDISRATMTRTPADSLSLLKPVGGSQTEWLRHKLSAKRVAARWLHSQRKRKNV